MDFNNFEGRFQQAISDLKISKWHELLKSAHLATKEIKFGEILHRWPGMEGLIGFYTKIGDHATSSTTARSITIYARMGGLNIGEIHLRTDRSSRNFIPHVSDKGTGQEISNAWVNTRTMGEFLSSLKTSRKTLFRSISKEHWVESQLLVLANNDLAKRAGLAHERIALRNMASIGLGKGKNKIPYQLPVPIKFEKSGEFPMRTDKWGYVDAILYSRFQELNIFEVKDPGMDRIDKDEYQALTQAYSYARCLRDYGGEDFRVLSCMSKIKKYAAVAVVGHDDLLLRRLKQDAKAILAHEKARTPNNQIVPKILTYSREEFHNNRLVCNLQWVSIE